MIKTDTHWIFIAEHQQKSYLHFVKVGWSLFSRSQQHSHKDSNDEEGKDSSNYSSSYGYRRGLLKWNIWKVTKIRFFKQFYKEFSNSCPLISTMCKNVIQPQAQKTPNLMFLFNAHTLFARCNLTTPTLLFWSYEKNIPRHVWIEWIYSLWAKNVLRKKMKTISYSKRR